MNAISDYMLALLLHYAYIEYYIT